MEILRVVRRGYRKKVLAITEMNSASRLSQAAAGAGSYGSDLTRRIERFDIILPACRRNWLQRLAAETKKATG